MCLREGSLVPFDPDEWRNIIERQAQDIDRLTGEP